MSTLRLTIILTGGALVAVLGLWTGQTHPSLATDPPRNGVSLNQQRGKMRRAASTRIIAAPAPVFLIGVSHSKPASRQ
jgi:hypothetical protein